MRPRNDVWQGCFGYWQNFFIQQNLLLLGYAAWNGYLKQGRGGLICAMTDGVPVGIDWQVERVGFTQQFLPPEQMAFHLQESGLGPAAIAPLIQAIAVYNPTYEIIVLIQGNDTIEANLLRPKITPSSCYEQLQRRWAEFQPDCLQPPGRSYA
jgi:hypothetical protein